ncbi:MAG TPA: type IX secretion system protein PorQ [Bacteroidota bacterium]|jgi:hypothetical protein|nr:type IX secretion system protein PorQ [Bacteroidota bacterium]
MRYVRKLLWFVFGLAAASSSLYAYGNGTYDFLRTDISPRSAGLGGSFVTMSDDPTTIFYNPAGIGTLRRTRFSVGFFKHLLDINSGYASYGSEISGLGFVGFGIQYINHGEFRRTGDEGQDLGTFGASEFAFSAGYAGILESGLRYGATAKFIYSSIAEVSSSGAAIDLGLQYSAIPGRMILGASLLNLGTQFDPYMVTREDLPLNFTIGVSVFPEHLPAVLQVNLHKLNEAQDKFTDRLKNFSVGVQLAPAENVQARIGYNNEQRQELKVGSSPGLAGLSAGGSVIVGMYTVDYAYTSYGEIGAVHRVSVTFGL